MKTVLALVVLSSALTLVSTDSTAVTCVIGLINGAAIYVAIRAKLLAA